MTTTEQTIWAAELAQLQIAQAAQSGGQRTKDERTTIAFRALVTETAPVFLERFAEVLAVAVRHINEAFHKPVLVAWRHSNGGCGVRLYNDSSAIGLVVYPDHADPEQVPGVRVAERCPGRDGVRPISFMQDEAGQLVLALAYDHHTTVGPELAVRALLEPFFRGLNFSADGTRGGR